MEGFETSLGYIKKPHLRTREKREGRGRVERPGVSGSSFKFLLHSSLLSFFSIQTPISKPFIHFLSFHRCLLCTASTWGQRLIQLCRASQARGYEPRPADSADCVMLCASWHLTSSPQIRQVIVHHCQVCLLLLYFSASLWADLI